MTSLIPTPNVSLIDGRPATTSLAIAEHFGKRHDAVVRDIRNLAADLPDDIRAHNFVETFRTVAGPNNSQRQEIYFTVFFDGFILLVMGYSGKKALQVKLIYIAAFNAMREQLAGHPHQPPALDTDTRLSKRTDPERKELRAMVNAWVGCAPLHYAAASSIINAHFGVKGVDEMTVAQVKQAIEFVRGKIGEASATPRALHTPKALPAPVKSYEEKCAEIMEQMYALSCDAFKASSTMARVFRDPFWSPGKGGIPEDKRAFAEAMNYAILDYMMATCKGVDAARLLFQAYVEGERILSA